MGNLPQLGTVKFLNVVVFKGFIFIYFENETLKKNELFIGYVEKAFWNPILENR